MDFFFVLATGLVAGTIGGIVGFGSSIMLMPVLMIVFGPLQAVPIMAIAAILAKAVVFRSFGALPWDIALKGLVVGSTLMAGAFIAKRFVLKMDAPRFRLLMDGLMLLSGLSLLFAAFI